MTESNFLNSLKKALDNGEFNSEAANKINEIAALAEKKLNEVPKGTTIEDSAISKSIDERLERAGVRNLSEEEAQIINSNYEKEMEKNKKIDLINYELATLTNMGNVIKIAIEDTIDYIEELDRKFVNEFKSNDTLFNELHKKIEEIKGRYNSIINN